MASQLPERDSTLSSLTAAREAREGVVRASLALGHSALAWWGRRIARHEAWWMISPRVARSGGRVGRRLSRSRTIFLRRPLGLRVEIRPRYDAAGRPGPAAVSGVGTTARRGPEEWPRHRRRGRPAGIGLLCRRRWRIACNRLRDESETLNRRPTDSTADPPEKCFTQGPLTGRLRRHGNLGVAGGIHRRRCLGRRAG